MIRVPHYLSNGGRGLMTSSSNRADLESGLLLRPAVPEDAPAVARVHVRSWQAGYRGLLPDAYLENLKPEARARRYDFGIDDPHQPATLVAQVEHGICGFATTVLRREGPSPGLGELVGLYVDPDRWGREVGSWLLAEAQARLAARGCRSAELWVLSGNVRAQRFYGRHGWRAEGATRTQEVWGITVEEARYTRRLP